MELCEHEEVNIRKENHLEYRKLISNAQKKSRKLSYMDYYYV